MSFAPGPRWEYNNANYLLAGLVLEHATHESVAAALRREILDPLGLRDVVLQPQERPQPGAAHGYSPGVGSQREQDLAAAETEYLKLSASTAARVLRFWQVRQATQAQGGDQVPQQSPAE